MSSSDKRADSGHRDVPGQNELRVKVAGLLGVSRDRWRFSIFPNNQPIIDCDGYVSKSEAEREWKKLKKDGAALSIIEKYKLSVTDLPDYPNDLNACLTLIDLLADKGWTCRLENGLDKTWECTFETGTSGHKNFKQHYVPDYVLAVAICRAFVKTMKACSVRDGNDSSNAGGVSKENR